MNYFEVKERLDGLIEFRTLYHEYSGFTNRETNVPAQAIRQKLEPLAIQTVDSLRRVGLGSVVTQDAPSRGGRKVRINLIKAIFRDRVIRHYSLDDRSPLEILDRGIVRYRSMLWKTKVQLLNPIFWLYHFLGFVAKLPIYICRMAGYDTEKAERLTSVRLYVIVFQIAVFFLLIRWSGLVTLIRFDILFR